MASNTVGIFKGQAGWSTYEKMVMLQSSRDSSKRASNQGYLYPYNLPKWARIKIAPKALSTWSS